MLFFAAVWVGQHPTPRDPEQERLEHQRTIKREADRRDEKERQAKNEFIKNLEVEFERQMRKN